LLWKFKNMVWDHRSSNTHLGAKRRASVDRYDVQLYTRLVDTYLTVDIWQIDAKDVSEQGATISSDDAQSLLSHRAQASYSFSPKSLLRLSTLSFLLYEQRKARKAHNTDVKSIFDLRRLFVMAP
jgi:hypothetical protein